MSSIIPLFPSAVMVCSAKHTLSAGEEAYIRKVEYGDNSGNLKSSSDRILEQPELAAMQAFVQKQIKREASREALVTIPFLTRRGVRPPSAKDAVAITKLTSSTTVFIKPF